MMEFQSALDELKPSLFELNAEAQLSSLLPPTLRYLLTLLTHRSPRYLLRILNRFDELHALLFLVLEHYYLTTYSSSFTEHFYSLKRVRVLRTRGGEVPRAQSSVSGGAFVAETMRLGKRDVWRNLAVLVGVLYVKRKLDEGFEVHVPQAGVGGMLLEPSNNNISSELDADATWRERLFYYYKWFLRNVYPGVNAASGLLTLAFNMAYLFDKSKYHDPLFWLVNTRMRRMSGADMAAIDQANNKASSPSPSSIGHRPGLNKSLLNPRILAATLLGSTRFLLPASIFALKFLEWWHASDFARQLSRKAMEGLVLMPPVIRSLPKQPQSLPPVASGEKDEKEENEQEKEVAQTNSAQPNSKSKRRQRRPNPPISASTRLPIFTVPPPPPAPPHPPASVPPISQKSPTDNKTVAESLCPICLQPIVTATATPYGYIYCYTCIHRWVEGVHERQVAFMEGRRWSDGLDEDVDDLDDDGDEDEGYADDETLNTERATEGEGEDREKGRSARKANESREGKWESGQGRCAITGRRILGGTEGLRRVVV